MIRLFVLVLLLGTIVSGCWGQEAPSPPTPTLDPTLLRPDTVYSFIRLEANQLTYAAHLLPFWEKLRSDNRKVRVLHIGDSHIQGDIQGREIRQRLYRVWGAGGRGYVFPYHLAGTSSAYDYVSGGGGQWLSARSVQPQPALPLGITGIALGTYDPTGYWEIRWSPAYQPVAPAGARLYLLTRTLRPGILCQLNLNGTDILLTRELSPGYAFTDFTLPVPLNALRGSWSWSEEDSLGYAELQGVFIEEGEKGITWYSMGIAGARLTDWASLPLLRESLRLLAPDLVVIDLGTNDLYAPRTSLWELRRAVEVAIDTIRSALPEAAILFTTPQDFYRSMRPLPMLAQASQVIRWVAAQKGIAVWDAYTILGSIREWRLAGLAAPDMVHLTTAGYVLKGQMFASAFLRSYEQFLNGKLPSPDSEKVGLTLPLEALSPSTPTVPLTPSITQFGGNGTAPATYTPPRPAYLYHKVRPGETLGEIARRYRTTVAAIQHANGLRGTTIRAGQTLRIPTTRIPASPPPTRTAPAGQGGTTRTHTVQPGESLWSIAQKYGTTVEALQKANGLHRSATIYPGQKLRIP